jgi:hypothetical protein
MLPSDGNHGLLSPKSLAFLITSVCVLIFFFVKGRFSKYQYQLIGGTFCAFSLLLLYLFIAIAYDPAHFTDAFDQFKLFVITWVVAIVSLYLVDTGVLTRERFLRTIIYLNCAFSVLKVTAVILHIFSIIKLFRFMELTGLRFMTLNLGNSVVRLQTSVDIVTPFLIFLVLQSDAFGLKFSKKFRLFFVFISLISLVLSFSRFLMGVALVAFFFYWISLSLPKMVRGALVAILFLMGAISAIGIDAAEKAFNLRFTSLNNFQSDETRLEQIEALMNEHDKYPFMGNGLGGAANNYLRDEDIPYSYEVQWVGFLMQFGAIGVLLLLAPLAFISMAILAPPLDLIKLGWFGMFGIWLLSGFTNPYMISLTSGIIYACFAIAGDKLGEKCSTPLPAPIPLRNT